MAINLGDIGTYGELKNCREPLSDQRQRGPHEVEDLNKHDIILETLLVNV